jgi:dihydrofolate reductase
MLKEIVVIGAMAGSRRVIGFQGRLPWPAIPVDLQRFRRLTWGQTLILGRKTWDLELGRQPLPGRKMIIVSGDPHWAEQYGDVGWAGSLAEGIEKAPTQQVFVGGGAGLFAEALPIAQRLELTLIEQDYPGDTFFPDWQSWIPRRYGLVHRETHPGFEFRTYAVNP